MHTILALILGGFIGFSGAIAWGLWMERRTSQLIKGHK
jgi:hypothetical protein